MQQIKYFCDTCEKECLPTKGLFTLAGFLMKTNAKFEKQKLTSQQDFCFECSEVVLKFISELKKDIKK